MDAALERLLKGKQVLEFKRQVRTVIKQAYAGQHVLKVTGDGVITVWNKSKRRPGGKLDSLKVVGIIRDGSSVTTI